MKARKAVVNDTRSEVSLSPWGADGLKPQRAQKIRIAINSERSQRPEMIPWLPETAVCERGGILEIDDSDYRSVYLPCEPFKTAAVENPQVEAVE